MTKTEKLLLHWTGLATCLSFVVAAPCRAQCAEWSRDFYHVGFDGPVQASCVFDDGSGPALFVGGNFHTVDTTTVNYIAKWDGLRWSALAGGLDTTVYALTVFDDGSGPALFAGGEFNSTDSGQLLGRVGKWNGTSWSKPGSGVFGNGWVRALCVSDLGTGPHLYAGGSFIATPGPTPAYIAMWDGSDWVPVGSGTNYDVGALLSFNDGSGEKLYAGGEFGTAGGVSAKRIAAWNGTSWSALGTGCEGGNAPVVNALTTFDDGSGAAVIAAGDFNTAGGVGVTKIAKWNGTAWSPLSIGTTGPIHALTTFDDGSGLALYAGGHFTRAGGVDANRVAKWNGTNWSAAGNSIYCLNTLSSNSEVNALSAFDDGSGPKLHAGGEFWTTVNSTSHRYSMARWDGVDWSPLPSYGAGVSFTVDCMTSGDIGYGPSLFAAGEFGLAGPVPCQKIARWDGSHWWSLGSGMNSTVNALCIFDDGGGPALYAGGNFSMAGGASMGHIAKWDGTAWSPLGTGVDSRVFALTTYDDGTGTALYAGGVFFAAGGTNVNYVAKWNGTAWSRLGTGTNNWVLALTVFDDGAGPKLYAGGDFTTASGVGANHIAKWNGTSWSPLATGMNDVVRAMTAFDDGNGPALYVGGDFTTAGGVGANRVAKWNGTNWSALSGGLDDRVWAMTSFDDGSGLRLHVGGTFIMADANFANGIAKWDGTDWDLLDTGLLGGGVLSMHVFDEGTGAGPDLYVGGSFKSAGGIESTSIARWGVCKPGSSFCYGDAVDPFVTTDCPCANFGAAGHGCANSNAALGGAELTALGTTSPNTVLFTCTGIPNNALATFWRGTQNNPAGGVVHDGIQCLGGTTIRFGQQFAGQGGNPAFTVSVGATALPPGSTRYYQVLYRNPAPGFCPPGQYNFSSGYKIVW